MSGIWIIWNLLGETKDTLSGIIDDALIKNYYFILYRN